MTRKEAEDKVAGEVLLIGCITYLVLWPIVIAIIAGILMGMAALCHWTFPDVKSVVVTFTYWQWCVVAIVLCWLRSFFSPSKESK